MYICTLKHIGIIHCMVVISSLHKFIYEKNYIEDAIKINLLIMYVANVVRLQQIYHFLIIQYLLKIYYQSDFP